MDLRALGEVVRRAREGRGWTLEDAAEHSGMSGGYISRLERGLTGNPKYFDLMRIADAYQMRVSELTGEDVDARRQLARQATADPRVEHVMLHAFRTVDHLSDEQRAFVLDAFQLLLRGLGEAQPGE